MTGLEPKIRAGNGSPSEITAMNMKGRGQHKQRGSMLQSSQDLGGLRRPVGRARPVRRRRRTALAVCPLSAGGTIKGRRE